MKVDDYSFGSISIDDHTYHKDVVIFPDRVSSGWWRKEGHRLDAADLTEAMAAKPRVLIVGTGYYGNMRVPGETERWIREQGVELHVAETPQAVELFNTMRDAAGVVAALHLTC